MRVCGIYAIKCLRSKKVYVGQSVHIHQRWYSHQYYLNKGLRRRVNPHLLLAWKKYGSRAFVLEVLEVCQPTELDKREQHWMNVLQAFGPNGYNARPVAHNMRGFKFSRAQCRHKSALSKAMWTPEHRARISAMTKGRKKGPMSLEQRAKLSAALNGRKMPRAQRLAIKQAMNKPEVSAKISLAQLGKKRGPHSPETNEKIRAGNLGKKHRKPRKKAP